MLPRLFLKWYNKLIMIGRKEMLKVLFVCSQNTCRSPMAEKICSYIAKQNHLKIKCASAGLTAVPNQKISENARLALAKLGIKNVRHKSTVFSLDMLGEYDYCIAMSEKHKNYIGKFKNVLTFSDIIDGAVDISDPYGKDLEEYVKCSKQLAQYISIFLRGVKWK